MKNIRPLPNIVLLAFLCLTSLAAAQVATYTDSNDFFNAIYVSDQTQDLENYTPPVPIYDTNSIDELILTYSFNDEIVTVIDSFDQVTFNGSNSLGLTGPDKTFLSGDIINFTLDSPSAFFGLYVIVSPGDARPGDLKLSFAGAEVENSDTPEIVLPDGGEAFFLGIVSDSEFGYTNVTLESIDATGQGLYLFNLDNITYPGCIANIDLKQHVTLSDFAKFGWYWLDTNCGLCGGADFTGDNKVLNDDLQVFVNNWLCETQQLIPGNYDDLTADHIQSLDYLLTTQPIDGSDGHDFYPGTFFIYQTNEGRYGKFIVENLEIEAGHRLTIAWQTFNPDGTIYSSGTGLTIRGTWLCDLDQGIESGTSGADWHWSLASSTSRSLYPYNNSRFMLINRAPTP